MASAAGRQMKEEEGLHMLRIEVEGCPWAEDHQKAADHPMEEEGLHALS